MAKDVRTFIKGRMNKELDERLVPDGEYTDALNIRIGSTEQDDMGVIETTLGNTQLTALEVQGQALSSAARCIGAYEDGSNETIYWFVHDPAFTGSANTNKVDLIVSYNAKTSVTVYHVISMDDGGGTNTTLNFSPTYLITGVDLIDDLLFFTDDYNPPRRINVTKTYGQPTTGDVDTIIPDELLVIKKAPVSSPAVTSNFNSALTSTFMKERFICFGYRWRYDDNEYSATSQFSDPVFTPDEFDFTPKSYLNEGFVNKHNNASITYNTGSKLVKGIDILFKEANDSTIKIIEKLDKEKLGLPDNNDLTFNFSDSKIFTILPNSEILRLYDNVPLLAQAQTLMGNRLMYGNYLEGYDLIDADGNATQLNYICTLRSSDITEEELPSGNLSVQTENYSLPVSVGGFSESVTAGRQVIDLTPFAIDAQGNSRLKAGSVMEFTFNLYVATPNSQTVGPGPFPSQIPPGTSTDVLNVSVTFTLGANYDTVADWMNSDTFKNQVGTLTNILPVYSGGGGATSCQGGSVTDGYNCGRPPTLGSFTFVTSGISNATSIAQPEPVIFQHVSGNTCRVAFPGLRYTDNPVSPVSDSFFFYRFSTTEPTEVRFYPLGTAESLHSNRGYEVGIIYMDDYNRSTTALVSNSNAVHIPCSASNTKNRIRVEIPTNQKPPEWATRYKFAIKPDEEGYNTIYSNTFFVDNNRNVAYILLQGENPRKVEEGDRLIVKADTSGPVDECLYVTVLEKKVMQADELPGNNGVTGTYMMISTDGLALNPSAGTFKDTGLVEAKAEDFVNLGTDRAPYIFLPMNDPIGNPSGGSVGPGANFEVPAGSIVTIKLQGDRIGGTNLCAERRIDIDEEYTVTQNYSSLAAWFVGESIYDTLINPDFFTGDGSGIVSWAGEFTGLTTPNGDPSVESGSGSANYETGNGKDDMRVGGGNNDLTPIGVPYPVAQSEFAASVLTYTSGRTYLGFRGTLCCGSNDRKMSKLKGRITVRRALDLLVFETLPADAQPDIFFESSASYPITNGFHEGNVQDQTAVQSAIIDTAFFNCYCFGNGVESYKVRDSIVGKDFKLGNRVTATQGQDYKQIRRYADITYSGVYNQESNVNKTNEFNLGLLNFKPLEQPFGYIRKMASRETDILVLQQDKISYVLAGKNLLSDAVGGGDITSIPEVLGTQIARTEEYGISDNPESYAEYGYDKYFTDAKRGVVIKLSGSSAQNETIEIISNQGMNTWFRDLFQVSFDRQKLGGYDPYAHEYVLSSNTKLLPTEKLDLPCNTSQTYIVQGGSTQTATYELGNTTGDVTITYSLGSGSVNDIRFTYDGVVYNTGPLTGPVLGTITVPKPNPTPTTGLFSIKGDATALITVKCPETTALKIVQVCLTSNSNAGNIIHNEFSFGVGTYTSPVSSTQVQFSTSGTAPVISQYDVFTGFEGEGFFPSQGSDVTMAANRFGTDNYITQGTDEFSFLRTTVDYPPTPAGMAALLTAITAPPPGYGGLVPTTGAGTSYMSGTFANIATATPRPILYLVYDYRDRSGGTTLCYDSSKPELACCCGTTTSVYLDGLTLSTSTGIYADPNITTPAPDGFYSDGSVVRQQTTVGGVITLTPISTCAACGPSCGTTLTKNFAKDGYYTANYELGVATGAVIIRFGNATIPYALRTVYNSTNYLKVSSTNHGELESQNANGYTLVGESVSLCSNAIGTTYLENYEANGTTFTSSSGGTSITLDSFDNETTPTSTGDMVMVFNKAAAVPDTLEVQIAAVCNGVNVEVEVQCPQSLPGTAVGRREPDPATACTSALSNTFYFVHTDGTVGGPVQLHDLVFTNAGASAIPVDGYFKTSATSHCFIQDGVVTIVGTCPP